MDHKSRLVEHYRDHELVSEIVSSAKGWEYVIHVVEHQGDDDLLRCKEHSTERYTTDLEALQAAKVRGHELVDALIAGGQ